MRYSFFAIARECLRNQQGVTAVLTAVAATALFGFVALAVDVGNLYVTRNELQNTADAAALAGARQLGVIYKDMTYEEQQLYVLTEEDGNRIKSQIHDVAQQSRSGGLDGLTIADQDILIGQWQANQTTGDPFSQTVNMPTAVRVIARRDDQANSPVSTLFASVIGTDLLPVSSTATAALTGKGDADPGELELPVGISSWWYENPEYCSNTIAFSPTNSPDSCAGWTSYQISPSNDAVLRSILNEEEGYDNDETVAGQDDFEFIGGDLSNPTFDALLTLFREKGYDLKPKPGYPCPVTFDENALDHLQPVAVDDNGTPVTGHTEGQGACPLYDDDGVTPLLYPDGTPRNQHLWETGVVVYQSADCANPNQSLTVVGFSEILMFDVKESPDKTIRAVVLCNYVDSGDSRGSGGQYGTLGSIPGLVQ